MPVMPEMPDAPETVIREEWGLPLDRAEAFFRVQQDGREAGEGRFRFDGCMVRLRALPERRVGGLDLPRLALEYSGEAEAVAALRRRFVLRFLSAGG